MKREKSCSLGGNEGFPTSISFDGRDRRKMTCIIHAKNKTDTIVVSDSWNTNQKNNHLTQKIVYNEQFPCIIGHAGDSESKYNDGTSISVLDFMNECVNAYNGNNITECINTLQSKSYKFIYDMNLDDMYERLVQYFIVYYDNITKTVESISLEIVKNTNGIHSCVLNDKINLNFTAFGRYWPDINAKYKELNDKTDDIKNLAIREVREKINLESLFSDAKRRVCGPIQWASISKDGTLTHGIEYI